jgi:hypothetical protein
MAAIRRSIVSYTELANAIGSLAGVGEGEYQSGESGSRSR